MVVNRAELLSKIDKLVTAESQSQPSLRISMIDDEDTPIEEGEEETLSPIQRLSPSDIVLGASSLQSL